MFYVSGRLLGGTMFYDAASAGWSAKEKSSRAWGEGGGWGAGIIMSSSDVGSYEFKRSSWMQMEECSAALARSTSDGSAETITVTIIMLIRMGIRRPMAGRACLVC